MRIRGRQRVQLPVPVGVREANVDDTARMVVGITEEAQPVEHTNPPVLWRRERVLRLTQTANSHMDGAPRRSKMAVQLRYKLVEDLEQPAQVLHFVHIEHPQCVQEADVLVAHLRC